MTTTHLQLPELTASQSQKHVTHNEALEHLDALVHLAVLDKDLSTPPASPSTGARYIVGASATDDWTSKEGEIAYYDGAGWIFKSPVNGWLAYVEDEELFYLFDGTSWSIFTPPGQYFRGTFASESALTTAHPTDDAGAFAFVDAAASDPELWIWDETDAAWAQASGGGGGDVAVDDDGTEVLTAATRLNFTGPGVSVSDGGSDEAVINILGGGGAMQSRDFARVYISADQATTGSYVVQKIDFDTVDEDDSGMFDTTNDRFQPTRPGLYLVVVRMRLGSTQSNTSMMIYKNGLNLKSVGPGELSTRANGGAVMIEVNGTTDYFELFTNMATADTIKADQTSTYVEVLGPIDMDAAVAEASQRSAYGGTANALTLTTGHAVDAPSAGLQVRFRATAANTGAATIDLDGTGAVSCVTVTGDALPADYIRTDADTVATYDGTNWVLDRQIERGSNADGDYVRFADGTQECWTTIVVDYTSVIRLSKSWTFPAAFATGVEPVVLASIDINDWSTNVTGPTHYEVAPVGMSVLGNSSVVLNIYKHSGTDYATGDAATAYARAIGDWY